MKSTNPITARVQSKFSNLTKDYSDCGCDSKSPAKNFSYAAKEAAESGAKEFSYAGKTFPVTAKKSMATKYNTIAKQTGDVKVKDVPEVVKDAVVEGGKKVIEGGKKVIKKILNTKISTEEGKKKREEKKALRKQQKEERQNLRNEQNNENNSPTPKYEASMAKQTSMTDAQNQARYSFNEKAIKQMEAYRDKKQDAEFAHKAKMTEKQMYGGPQITITSRVSSSLAGPGSKSKNIKS
jgi:hypothetical protein